MFIIRYIHYTGKNGAKVTREVTENFVAQTFTIDTFSSPKNAPGQQLAIRG